MGYLSCMQTSPTSVRFSAIGLCPSTPVMIICTGMVNLQLRSQPVSPHISLNHSALGCCRSKYKEGPHSPCAADTVFMLLGTLSSQGTTSTSQKQSPVQRGRLASMACKQISVITTRLRCRCCRYVLGLTACGGNLHSRLHRGWPGPGPGSDGGQSCVMARLPHALHGSSECAIC